MSNAEYKKMTLAAMKTKRWRTTRVLRSHVMTVKAGAEVQITDKRNGLTLSGPVCAVCGVSIFMRRCEPDCVEEIRVS